MSLATIREETDTEYVAIPITPLPSVAPSVEDTTELVVNYDSEQNDKWAGFKHCCLCLIMIGLIPYLVYLFWKVHA